MEIVDFGHFVASTTSHGLLVFTNEDGQDWYQMRFALTRWNEIGEYVDAVYGVWAMAREDGIITNVERDPSRLMPGDRTVLGIDAELEDVRPGMIWRDGEILPATEESRREVG